MSCVATMNRDCEVVTQQSGDLQKPPISSRGVQLISLSFPSPSLLFSLKKGQERREIREMIDMDI